MFFVSFCGQFLGRVILLPFLFKAKEMTVYSKQSYEDQDDGHILKAARKQQYFMFPAPIAFLNDELKAELGMKSKRMMQNFAH
jgi:hypothetical protein